MFLCAVSAQATTFYFDNSETNGLWTEVENWHDQFDPIVTNTLNEVPDDPSDVAYIIQGAGGPDNTATLDQDYSIKSIRASWGVQGGTAELVNPAGTTNTLALTGSGDNNLGVLNQAGTAGGRLLLNCGLEVINEAGNNLTFCRNDNSASNVIEFGTSSTLTLTTALSTHPGGKAGNTIEFNGTLAPSLADLRIGGPNVSFNAGHDSSAFGRDLVLQSIAGAIPKLTVNGGTVLAPFRKLQVNSSGELALNGANAWNGANLVLGGAKTLLLNVNSDQENMGTITLGTGILTIDLDATVTNLSFADCVSNTWSGAVTITNFMTEVVRFGTTETGISPIQLAAVTAYDSAGVLVPDLDINASGYLTGTVTPTDTPAIRYANWCALYPSLANTNFTHDAEPDGVINLMEYALGGDPTVDDAAAISPAASLEDIAGTTFLVYVYSRRLDALERGLTYAVLSGTDLNAGLATPTIEVDSGPSTAGFETVTNAVSTATEDVQFMKLTVEFMNE